MARRMMWTALGLIFVIRLLSGMTHGWGTGALLLAMAPYPPLVLLLRSPWPARPRHTLAVLVAMLAVLPFALIGAAWDWLPWTVGVAVLVAFRGRTAAALFAGLLGAVLAGGLLAGDPVAVALSRTTATVNDGLIIFSLYSLAGMVRDLAAARGELARLAMLRERLRLDSRLRDVVGGDLRAIGERLASGVGGIREAVELARRALAGIRQAAGEYRTAGVAAEQEGFTSPRIVWLALLGVLVMQAVSGAAIVASVSAVQLVVVVPLLAAIVALYLVPRPPLAVLAALTFPLVWPGSYLVPAWGQLDGMWGFFIGLSLLRLKWPAVCAITASVLCLHVVMSRTPPPALPPVQIAMGLVSDLILGGLVYSLARLGELVATMNRARHELADVAVARERVRIARDLHDVLGFSLSAVALRGELAIRLADRDPERAAAELDSLRELVERSAAELASITDGRIRLRLGQEIDAAREVLAAAGIAAEITVSAGPLTRETDTALAAVLRESVTNLLRHSQARNCVIAVAEDGDLVRLTVANDGAEGPSGPQRTGGLGLASMTARTDGRLRATMLPNGWFELAAEFGSDPAGPGSSDPAGPGSSDPAGPGSSDPAGPGSSDPAGLGSSDPAGLGSDANGVDPVAGAELRHR